MRKYKTIKRYNYVDELSLGDVAIIIITDTSGGSFSHLLHYCLESRVFNFCNVTDRRLPRERLQLELHQLLFISDINQLRRVAYLFVHYEITLLISRSRTSVCVPRSSRDLFYRRSNSCCRRRRRRCCTRDHVRNALNSYRVFLPPPRRISCGPSVRFIIAKRSCNQAPKNWYRNAALLNLQVSGGES